MTRISASLPKIVITPTYFLLEIMEPRGFGLPVLTFRLDYKVDLLGDVYLLAEEITKAQMKSISLETARAVLSHEAEKAGKVLTSVERDLFFANRVALENIFSEGNELLRNRSLVIRSELKTKGLDLSRFLWFEVAVRDTLLRDNKEVKNTESDHRGLSGSWGGEKEEDVSFLKDRFISLGEDSKFVDLGEGLGDIRCRLSCVALQRFSPFDLVSQVLSSQNLEKAVRDKIRNSFFGESTEKGYRTYIEGSVHAEDDTNWLGEVPPIQIESLALVSRVNYWLFKRFQLNLENKLYQVEATVDVSSHILVANSDKQVLRKVSVKWEPISQAREVAEYKKKKSKEEAGPYSKVWESLRDLLGIWDHLEESRLRFIKLILSGRTSLCLLGRTLNPFSILGVLPSNGSYRYKFDAVYDPNSLQNLGSFWKRLVEPILSMQDPRAYVFMVDPTYISHPRLTISSKAKFRIDLSTDFGTHKITLPEESVLRFLPEEK